MRTRFLVVASLAGALALFVWQTASNTVIPWHEATLHTLADSAVVRQLRAAAPANGVYVAKEGVLAAIAIAPDFADRSTPAAMMPMMARQVAIDAVAMLVLALVLLRLQPRAPLVTGGTFALAGLAGGLLLQLSDWNWYGFALDYALVNAADHAVQFFLAGWLLETLRRRMPVAGEAAGVRAGGGLPEAPVEARPGAGRAP
jgi:hypothetical protein